jgi:hypothetical protein
MSSSPVNIAKVPDRLAERAKSFDFDTRRAAHQQNYPWDAEGV